LVVVLVVLTGILLRVHQEVLAVVGQQTEVDRLLLAVLVHQDKVMQVVRLMMLVLE
jgi:hypothetical protein